MCRNCDNGITVPRKFDKPLVDDDLLSDALIDMMRQINPDLADRMEADRDEEWQSIVRSETTRMTSQLMLFRSRILQSVKISDSVTLHVLDNHPIYQQHVTNLVAHLRILASKTPPPEKVDVYFPAIGLEQDGGETAHLDSNGNVSFEGKSRAIFLSPSLFDGPDPRMPSVYVMPVFWGVDQWKYVLTHEWGHVIDTRPMTDLRALSDIRKRLIVDVKADVSGSPFNSSLSFYGRTKENEAYAEAFVEWFLSNGKTNNFAANWYANEYGWKMNHNTTHHTNTSHHNRTH